MHRLYIFQTLIVLFLSGPQLLEAQSNPATTPNPAIMPTVTDGSKDGKIATNPAKELEQMLAGFVQLGDVASTAQYGRGINELLGLSEEDIKKLGLERKSAAPSAEAAHKEESSAQLAPQAGQDPLDPQHATETLDGVSNNLNSILKFSLGAYGKLLEEELKGHAKSVETSSEEVTAAKAAATESPSRSRALSLVGEGNILQVMGDHASAEKKFQEAIKADPEFGSAYYNYACSAAHLGKAKIAIAALGRAIALDPKYLEMAKRDHDLESVKSNDDFLKLVDGR